MRRVPAHLSDLVAGVVARGDEQPVQRRDLPAVEPRPRPEQRVDRPNNEAFLARIAQATPSRIAVGRAGVRFPTGLYIELRADHAVARDAVYAEVAKDAAATLGCIEVRSQCTDREHYLLYPNAGRRLDDASRRRLEAEGTRGADVQLIVADGLAAPALAVNVPTLLPALTAALGALGHSVGKPILARLARVGLQDDIGVLLSARATVICLGERPGLGTGDSLSIYIAISPAIDQDNSEKNCISNIRPLGLAPESAANVAASLLHRGLQLGRGGLALA